MSSSGSSLKAVVHEMNEIVPGIWTWSVREPDRDIDFNGWYVNDGREAVVIDPPAPSAEVLGKIRELGMPKMIILTNANHTRAAVTLREAFHSPIYVHQNDRVLMSVRAQGWFKHGQVLPCGLRAVTVADGKTPGESALLHEASRSLIVGDAVIRNAAGELSMLPPEKFRDPQAAKEGLSILLEQDFDALLLGDGEPIVEGGKAKLEAFLVPKKPWEDEEIDDDDPVPGRAHDWMEVEDADVHIPPDGKPIA